MRMDLGPILKRHCKRDYLNKTMRIHDIHSERQR